MKRRTRIEPCGCIDNTQTACWFNPKGPISICYIESPGYGMALGVTQMFNTKNGPKFFSGGLGPMDCPDRMERM